MSAGTVARQRDQAEPVVAAALRQQGPSERLASAEGEQGVAAEVAPAAQPQGWVVVRVATVAMVATVATVERPAAREGRPVAAASREPLAEVAREGRPAAVASRALPAAAGICRNRRRRNWGDWRARVDEAVRLAPQRAAGQAAVRSRRYRSTRR